MIKKVILMFFIFFLCGIGLHADDSGQQFYGFDLVGYADGGHKAWDVKGDTADVLGNLIKLTNIVGNVYGDEQVNIKAQKGTMNKETGSLHLDTDVVITTETGARLETDSLDWERNKDLVTTDDEVFLKKENMTANGKGAIAHPNLQTTQLNEDVTVELNVQEEGAPGRIVTISCDGPLEIDYQNQTAVFNNNVVAIDMDREIRADKIELFIDNETNEIKEMICTGNVTIIQGKNSSHSEKAIYKAAEQKLILLGRPKIIFYTEESGGDNSVPFGN